MGSREEVVRRITKERQAIQLRLREIDSGTMYGGSGGHLSSDGHSRDVFEQAQQELLKGQEAREYEILAARAKVLDRAWQRLRRGTYGVCQRCGAQIAPRRLEAVPGATLCISCQEKEEQIS